MIFFISGEMIALMTFPGVIMHEIAHRLACDFFRVPVYEIGYFNLGSKRAGHVRHGRCSGMESFWIGVAPLFINGILSTILTFPYFSSDLVTGDPSISATILCWIGISMAIHALPSNQDVSSITEENAPAGFVFFCYIIEFLNEINYFSLVNIFLAGLFCGILPRLVFSSCC